MTDQPKIPTLAARVSILRSIAKEAMTQGAELEKEAERWRIEGELAYQDAGAMKTEGRERAAKEGRRMLPAQERAIDIRTNSFKAVQDAKGDFVLFMSLASTYAAMAQMKYAKATALNAEILAWQNHASS